MTKRQKKGIGWLISAGAFGIAGGIAVFSETDPSWLWQTLQIVATVAAALGFTTVFPNEGE